MNTHDFKNTHWTRCPITGPAELHFAEAALRQTRTVEDDIKHDIVEYYHRNGQEVPPEIRVLLGMDEDVL